MAANDRLPSEPADGAEFEVDCVGAEAADVAELEAYAGPVPDALDSVLEVADMMTVFAAQRFVRIDGMRREALADAERFGRGLPAVVDRGIRLELAAAMRITEYAAGMLIARAEAVVRRYPGVLASLSSARMTERHAEVLVDAVDGVEPEFRDRVLAAGIALAETEPVGTFSRALRRLVETVRAETLAERHQNALKARRVYVEPAEDGMGWLMLLAPMVELRAIEGRVTAISKVLAAEEDETRTLDQLRSDVVCDLLVDGDTDVHPVRARGIRATVAVTVPALALLAADGQASGVIATVEGIGPIPLARARDLCGGADDWMRILTHPETGMVLSVGRERYRAPESLRRLVRWRADRCMAPGCGIPAARCEIDHTIAACEGGETSLENHAPLCTGHHHVKHHGGWTVRQLKGSGGALEWTSPAGRRYVVQPERRVPVFTVAHSDDGRPPF